MKGSVFLIPTYLSENNDSNFLAPMVLDIVRSIDYFLVENVRTARRFVSSLNLGLDISTLNFEEVNKNSDARAIHELMQQVLQGKDVAVMSEAGLPGLADPGGLIVKFAHQHELKVVPLPGASSIQTALICSGFNGQQFSFHGYLPIQKPERVAYMKKMEQLLKQTNATQIFMETPFRNMSLMNDLLATLDPTTLLSIASDVFGRNEILKTQSVKAWKSSQVDLHKIPTVFSIGFFS
ncbi:MAG: 16S rRNA (cytidine1402-2'-O)-methyltransferase [Marinoscillum sp.]|jgi:16S rRNA (cytidine1402-2'-O)-methyltransferase